ncbi:D-lactate dehydrogenase [Parelusimicrobium proximum]|uniref:NAD(P)-dependent oxidoreductase n=1 Tax=Parelusimicrobium proximum TaxID=3228953 RepID=UPI003D17DBB2
MNIIFFDISDMKPDYDALKKVKNKVKITESKYSVFDAAKVKGAYDADAVSVFTANKKITDKVLAKFKNLKYIFVRSTGYDHVDLDYCKKNNIRIFNVPNYGETAVAEYTIALILGLTRNIIPANNNYKNGKDIKFADYTGRDLSYWTLGIIGTGSIGRSVISKALCLGITVIAYDPYPNKAAAKEMGFKYVSLEELYKKANVISLHAPATKDNYHMLNANAFKKMQKGVHIINTGRGTLIDNKALYQALKTKKVAGAALDVLEDENLLMHRESLDTLFDASKRSLVSNTLNSNIMEFENVITTPHIAFDTLEARMLILKNTSLNIAGVVNPKLYKPNEVILK